MSDKTDILLWSGGFDSTACLLSMMSNPEKFPRVRVVGCGLKGANNYVEDKEARTKIADILKLDTTSSKLGSHITYWGKSELDFDIRGGIQATVWAALAALSVCRDDSDVRIVCGYIKGDDFWHYKTHFEQAVRSLVAITADSTRVSFHYPWEWNEKKEIVNYYLHHPEVFSNISWGGDTKVVKAKEREELEFLLHELLAVKKDIQENSYNGTPTVLVENDLTVPLPEPFNTGGENI